MTPEIPRSVGDTFGGIDIYIFDQLQRGRIAPGMRVLDAGCGDGRNLTYLARAGYDITAVDESPDAVAKALAAVRAVRPDVDAGRFLVHSLDALPFDDAAFDVVVSVAVLHFARDPRHFEAMLRELWRVLAPGGLFLARLASSIGIEGRIEERGSGRYLLPDGTERYLVSEATLLGWTDDLNATLVDPIKTTNVQGTRAMTTWCIRRSA